MDKRKFKELFALGYKYSEMSRLLRVSETYLFRVRKRAELPETARAKKSMIGLPNATNRDNRENPKTSYYIGVGSSPEDRGRVISLSCPSCTNPLNKAMRLRQV